MPSAFLRGTESLHQGPSKSELSCGSLLPRVVLKDDTISNLERPPDLFLLFELLYDDSHRILHYHTGKIRASSRPQSVVERSGSPGRPGSLGSRKQAFGGKRFVDYAEGELLLVKEVGHHISRESYDGAPQS
ncbi:hypothetical protein FOPG_20118 [Fusarium oxysporum f. sp. conglutinans race 2 54008]|uniref:Uncharacterized protein n=1 Tax=Fusarium oxysporum f. sp. conglutinans race 2 54008 TaxID=1089457 RepID=X0GJX1_FUSOX|nr:hypothetical protein FOPG_20118 [Fusarium oxysporum f. sp. conglutinans race 2 54008]